MRLKRFASALLFSVLAAACDCSSDASSATEAQAGLESRTDEFRDHRVHTDFQSLLHLADVDREGLFIDFGTPAESKYTVGGWRSGWGSQVAEGDRTATFVGRRGRVYFHSAADADLHVRLRLRPHGTGALTPWFNNEQLTSLHFPASGDFRNVDFVVPKNKVRRGENYLLLTFGGATKVGEEDVSVAMDWIRIRAGQPPGGEQALPDYETLISNVRIDGEDRTSIAVRSPTTLSWHVLIPEQAHLSFGVGAESQSGGVVRAVVTPEGGPPTEIYRQSLGANWHNAVTDLTEFAGKTARIQLITEATTTESRTTEADTSGHADTGRIAWSTPALLVPPAEPQEREHGKNVVVLLIDTLRAEKLRAYNPRSRVETPVLDKIAAEGTVFELAQAPENWTKPSVASVLTGLYPLTHGAKESESRLPKEALLLSEHLKAEGFATGSFIANGYVSDRFGFDQGWDHYTNYIREGKSTEAEHVFGEAMEWIEGHQGERFFAYIQTIDPHVPYDPPAAYLRMYDDRHYDGQVRPRKTPELLEQAKRNPPQVTFSASDRRRLEALHDAEITQHDHHLGTFVNRMKELELWDNTLFVVVSDHGEEFGEHGSWGHGHSVYQELLHVPLFARLPDSIPAGRRIKDAVTTLDVPATVVDLLGVSPMPTEGESLMDLVDGIPSSRPRIAFSDFLHDRRVAVSGHWKFILRGNLTASMFDLRKDPQEVDQLDLNVHPIAQRFLRIHLGQYLGASDRANWIAAEQGPGIRVDQQAAEMDDAIRAQLRALGYAN